MVTPVLVAVSPPTADARCREATRLLVTDLARAVPEVDVVSAFLDDSPAGLVAIVSRLSRRAVLVPTCPALPADVTGRMLDVVEHARVRVDVAASPGPDRRLARAAVARLRAAGACWGDAVVLVSPEGSIDSGAVFETERTADQLASEWGPRVSVAAPSSDSGLPSAAEAVSEWIEFGHPRVFVVPYVLTYAAFLPEMTSAVGSAGATGVTAPLGPHRLVTDLLVSRYEQAVRPRVRGAVSAA